MKRNIAAIIIFIINACVIYAGETANSVIKGKVVSKFSGEVLPNVNIIIKQSNYFAATDRNGTFKVEGILPGKYLMVFSHIGFAKTEIPVEVESSEIKEVFVEMERAAVNLGEIIITSSKFFQVVKETSLPFEVVDQSIIDSKPVNSLPDILDTEPGISIQRDGIWATSLSIRGLSKDNIVTLIDGSRIETSSNLAAALSLIDLNDIERVEVIKGSASSLYGTGATGGVVNIISRGGRFTEDFTFGGSVNSSYSSVNSGSTGSVSLNAGSANWFGKLNFTVRYADDTKTGSGRLENSGFRDNNISARLGIAPFESHSLQLDYQKFSAKDVGIPGGSSFTPESKATYLEAERELYSISYSINNLLPSLTGITARYFHQEIFRNVEILPNLNVIVNPYATHKIDGASLQTNWLINNKNFFIAGIDFWQRIYTGKRERTVIPQKLKFIEEPLPLSKFSSLGFFAQNEIKSTDDFTLTTGGRIDFINVSNEVSYSPVDIISLDAEKPSPILKQKLMWEKSSAEDVSWSLNISALHRINENSDITFNAARSFRSPSLEERYQFIELGGSAYLGDPNLEPEVGWFFDAGTRFWYNNFSFRTNVFINLMNNLVIDKKENDSTYIKRNVGEAVLYGIESNWEYSFNSYMVFYGAVSYVRGRDTGNDINLPQIPPMNGKLGLRINILEFLNVDLSSRIFAAQNDNAPEENQTPGYAVFNLNLSSMPIESGFLKLKFFSGIENIFDRSYKNHLSTYRGIVNLEPGRNFYLKINLLW